MTEIKFTPDLDPTETKNLQGIAGIIITGTTVTLEEGVNFTQVWGPIHDALCGITRKSVNMTPVEV
jgi:hypothetical protein